MELNNSTPKKALLAIAFAGSVLNPQLPVCAQNEGASTSSQTDLSMDVIQHFVKDEHGTPEIRAYYLLNFAEGFLSGQNKKQLEAQYIDIVPNDDNERFFGRRRANHLTDWANRISSEECGTTQKVGGTEKPGDSALADCAISEAVQILKNCSAKFEQMNMLFIASRLYHRSGNTDGMRGCDMVLEQSIRAAEKSPTVLGGTLNAACSVLNSMAFGIVPISIPDQDPGKTHMPQQPLLRQPTEKEITNSERLKLRALAISDRLSATEHNRRKAHRDLALWYEQVGKPELAEEQKRILFGLVGVESDDIMYARYVGCGNVAWWDNSKQSFGYDCGMG